MEFGNYIQLGLLEKHELCLFLLALAIGLLDFLEACSVAQSPWLRPFMPIILTHNFHFWWAKMTNLAHFKQF